MKYYVYTLSDPRDGQAFYIGKGTGNRIDAHEREARRGQKSAKCDRIRDIEANGFAVAKDIVKWFADERAAFEYEALLIEAQKDELTNMTPGGSGGWSTGRVDPWVAKWAGKLDLYMVVLALISKVRRPIAPFAAALHTVLASRADELICRLLPKIDHDELAREMRLRGVDLLISEELSQFCRSNQDNPVTLAVVQRANPA